MGAKPRVAVFGQGERELYRHILKRAHGVAVCRGEEDETGVSGDGYDAVPPDSSSSVWRRSALPLLLRRNVAGRWGDSVPDLGSNPWLLALRQTRRGSHVTPGHPLTQGRGQSGGPHFYLLPWGRCLPPPRLSGVAGSVQPVAFSVVGRYSTQCQANCAISSLPARVPGRQGFSWHNPLPKIPWRATSKRRCLQIFTISRDVNGIRNI